MSAERNRFYVALLVGLLLPVQAQAILIGARQFDRSKQRNKVVIKVQILSLEKGSSEINAFKAKIVSILKSDGGPIPENLSLKVHSSIWPVELGVPCEVGQTVLVVLRRGLKRKLVPANHSGTILPSTKNIIDYKNGSSTKRKVFDELHAFLPQAKDEVSQALVLVNLSRLASKADEKFFLPYTKSKNEWLQRASVASLLRLNPTDERVQAAVSDFKKYLPQTLDAGPSKMREDFLFWKIYQEVRWLSGFGADSTNKEMAARAKVYLPIYRVLADKSPSNYNNIRFGIIALINFGDREDIHRLYKLLDSKNAWIRHGAIESIGRILGMEIKRPLNRDYELSDELPPIIKQWESDSRAAVQKTMIEQGLLEEDIKKPTLPLPPSNPNALLELLFKDGTPQPNDVEIKAIYGILYKRMLKEVDLDGIKKLVEQLGSDDEVAGKKALSELEKRVGLKQPVIESHGSIFPMTGTPAEVWGKYAENLEVAVNIKIPLIINNLRSSRRKSFDRHDALFYLGENCPHPAFLPILKAIAIDKKEGLRSAAIRSIAAIPHQGMIDFLIDRLTDKPIGIALNTYERLQALTGAKSQKIIVYFDVKKSWEGVDWESTKMNYKKWWKEHKGEHDFSKSMPPMQHVGLM